MPCVRYQRQALSRSRHGSNDDADAILIQSERIILNEAKLCRRQTGDMIHCLSCAPQTRTGVERQFPLDAAPKRLKGWSIAGRSTDMIAVTIGTAHPEVPEKIL